LEVFLKKLTIDGHIEMFEGGEQPQFIIRTHEAGVLIGERGRNLDALYHLTRAITERQLPEGYNSGPYHFFLDVNDYRAKRIEQIKNQAQINAQKVMYFKREVQMDPMNSAERRIVHSILTKYPDIITESAGEGKDRRVVIKPLV
jgi:spoIIIJ-associated protein